MLSVSYHLNYPTKGGNQLLQWRYGSFWDATNGLYTLRDGEWVKVVHGIGETLFLYLGQVGESLPSLIKEELGVAYSRIGKLFRSGSPVFNTHIHTHTLSLSHSLTHTHIHMHNTHTKTDINDVMIFSQLTLLQVPLDASVINPLLSLLPSRQYNVIRRTAQFQEGEDLGRRELDEVFPPLKTKGMSEAVDRPLVAAVPTTMDDLPAPYYWASELRVQALPVHEVVEEVVARYVREFEADSSYCPTVLLYAPTDFPPIQVFGTMSVILDGHHKLAAAVRLKRPVQLLLLLPYYEPREDATLSWEFDPLPWSRAADRRQAIEYLHIYARNLRYDDEGNALV